MYEGHVKLFRKIIKSSFYQDSQYVHLWVHLLLSVNWTDKRLKINGSDRFIDLKPGQVLTSRDSLSKATGINSSKIERILKAFESEQQIEQQTYSKYRVISISNWVNYQSSEQQNEQQMNSKRTADEHKQEGKERKEVKPSPRKKPSGDHATFIDWWCFAYEKLAQRKYAFVDKKDGASVKFILSQFPLKDAIAIACHFLLVEDKFFQGKRDLGMMRSNINRLPAPERCDIATARAWGILPPVGTMFEDWNYRTEEAA